MREEDLGEQVEGSAAIRESGKKIEEKSYSNRTVSMIDDKT